MKMKKYLRFTVVLMALTAMAVLTFGQGFYQGPNDPAGDKEAEREGTMDGNRVHLKFQNTTELSNWPDDLASIWPKGDGTKMLDGVGLLVGARVYIRDDADPLTIDTIPVTDTLEIKFNPNLHVLHYLQTSYREEMDADSAGLVEWGFYPVFGYFNETSEYPAMSDDSLSWPIAGWPSGQGLRWSHEWDGRFGRGIQYADLETYFVVNDAHDQEYLGPKDMVRYYPRPGVEIGDDITIQAGYPWGGLGIRVETRGFQWNNPQARDALFWEYNIANISDYDLTEVCFGYWVDNAIGGEGPDDDIGYFSQELDLAYSWDIDGVGDNGYAGIMGFAYLESPGIDYDDKDNDGDGLVNERRDNVALAIVGPTDGIDNLPAFLDFYDMDTSQLKAHWDADEDQDWQDGDDLNGDGRYQAYEPYGDDVGLDGLGPLDINYPGPDQGEANHRPDFDLALGDAEPNFALTDVSESDMSGLNTFLLFELVNQHPAPSGTPWFRNDDVMWDSLSLGTLKGFYGDQSNLVELFASGPFHLRQGGTERISMAEIHSSDPVAGINPPGYTAPALFQLKKIVQLIYESDYRFAQPPEMPTLSATAGDGQVILSWDDASDKLTRDPFVGNKNDFEGYKLYKATDKFFTDAELITDGYGTPIFFESIFQCDLVDDIYGFAEFGLVNGVAYNLGSDTGLKHFFIDDNVENGRTYYYGLVAYDYGVDPGDNSSTPGIAPSENNMVVSIDDYDQIKGVGKNVQIVVPRSTAAGYHSPAIELDSTQNSILGTGTIQPMIYGRDQVIDNQSYEITFIVDTLYNKKKLPTFYMTSGYRISKVLEDTTIEMRSESAVDSAGNINYILENLVYDESLAAWSLASDTTIISDPFDGVQLMINQDVMLPKLDPDPRATGWIEGGYGNFMNVSLTRRETNLFPYDYEIVFTGDTSAYTSKVVSPIPIYDEFDKELWLPLFPIRYILGETFDFYVINTSLLDSTGNHPIMDMVVQDYGGTQWTLDRKFNKFQDKILVGSVDTAGIWQGTAFVIDFIGGDSTNYPGVGDRYQIGFKRPFWSTDTIRFTTKLDTVVDVVAEAFTMDSIKVVPNPYVGTNAMEGAVRNRYLNQPRRIMFTHLPAQCTIRIFTSSGVLIKTLEVDNIASNGSMHWNLLTDENLEIAAGMYIYHVESEESGREHIGKFAVLK
ncbi:MAG: hypothetical protein K9N35_10845 [Candidatus Marinimicrobia bacterium]|nr:hypothetical protein [Candidatus Neomarinimicrobiota bacterium]